MPGLTFGNAVLCIMPEVQSRLKVKQHGIGRLALGAQRKIPHEGAKRDGGRLLFEAREANSKLELEERLRETNEERWAGRIFRYLYTSSVDTR